MTPFIMTRLPNGTVRSIELTDKKSNKLDAEEIDIQVESLRTQLKHVTAEKDILIEKEQKIIALIQKITQGE